MTAFPRLESEVLRGLLDRIGSARAQNKLVQCGGGLRCVACVQVVATGGGPLGVSLLGKKVAIMGSRVGTFGQYAVCSAMTTFKLPEEMPAKDGYLMALSKGFSFDQSTRDCV